MWSTHRLSNYIVDTHTLDMDAGRVKIVEMSDPTESDICVCVFSFLWVPQARVQVCCACARKAVEMWSETQRLGEMNGMLKSL